MALPNKNYLLEAYGNAIAIELNYLFNKENYNLINSYYKQNIITVYCNYIFKNRDAPKIIYIPFYYQEFLLDICKPNYVLR